MDSLTFKFIESLGVVEDLQTFIKENPEVVQGDQGFEGEVIEQISLIVQQRFTPEEMIVIADFHNSPGGRAWLNKNTEMGEDIDKLFKAHAVSKLSQQLFGELNLLPVEKDEDETVN